MLAPRTLEVTGLGFASLMLDTGNAADSIPLWRVLPGSDGTLGARHSLHLKGVLIQSSKADIGDPVFQL